MLKLTDNPPILSPGVNRLADLSGRWWVGHTKARFEKAFARDLLLRQIGYFLPMVQRVIFSGGRKRSVMAPLFPSYVFFCGQDKDRYAALTTNRLCQAIDVPQQADLVAELSAVEQALAGKAHLDPYPFAAVGERCRVKAGPFLGLEGVVVRRDRRTQIVLSVSILGQGAAMEIDAGLLEPVG